MSADDEFHFRPKPGRIRADTPKAGKAKSFLTQAKKIARQHSNGPSRSSISSPPRSRARATAKGGKASRTSGGPGLKRGRGAAFVARPHALRRLASQRARSAPRRRQNPLRPGRGQERKIRRASALYPARRYVARRRARPALFRRARIAPTARPLSSAARTIATSSASSSRPKTARTCPTSRPIRAT